MNGIREYPRKAYEHGPSSGPTGHSRQKTCGHARAAARVAGFAWAGVVQGQPLPAWWKPAAAVMSAVMLSSVVWGVAIGPRRLRVERHRAAIPHLPACWQGRHLALLSDLQVGMPFGNEGVVATAVRDIVRRRPAAVLLAGDFVLHPHNDPAPRIEAAVGLLRPLARAGLPTFAVLGNHDYQLESDPPRTPPLDARITGALEDLGITVLRNEAVALRPGSRARRGRRWRAPAEDGDASALFIVGLGERRMDDDDVDAALEGLPPHAPRVVMMHNPDTFPHLPAGSAPFAIAGHTHGAQVSPLPGNRSTWLLRMAGMPGDLQRGAGWIDPGFGRPGNRLYITRGIGFSHVPVRINAPPELTYFRLTRA
jgi:uncharacterized protein